MTTTQSTTSVSTSVDVECPIARAFHLFTAEIGTWWDDDKHILEAPLAEMIFEPRVGGIIIDRGTDAANVGGRGCSPTNRRTWSGSAGTSTPNGRSRQIPPGPARSRSPSPRRRPGAPTSCSPIVISIATARAGSPCATPSDPVGAWPDSPPPPTGAGSAHGRSLGWPSAQSSSSSGTSTSYGRPNSQDARPGIARSRRLPPSQRPARGSALSRILRMLAQDVGVLAGRGLGTRVAGVILVVLAQFVLGIVRLCRLAHDPVLPITSAAPTRPRSTGPGDPTCLGRGIARVGDELAQRAAGGDAQFDDQQLAVGVELADGFTDVAFAQICHDQRALG